MNNVTNKYNPLVSIIIPVYNGANYMKQAIDSALAQTYENVEVIVIDDGSTDNGDTERIALSYGERIAYYKKENGGCASTLNYGISKMNGEWFSWLSHDDVYEPDKIKREIECIEENGLNRKNTIISCGAQIIDGAGNKILRPSTNDVGFYNSDKFVKRLLFHSSLNGCGLLIPKNVIDKVGAFSTELKFILDFEYWLRAALAGVCLYRIGNEKLVMNRIHQTQVTVKCSDRRDKEIQMIMDALLLMVMKNESLEVKKNFYIYSEVIGLTDIRKKYREELNKYHALNLGLKIRAKFLKNKKQVRRIAAKFYWKIIRSRRNKHEDITNQRN